MPPTHTMLANTTNILVASVIILALLICLILFYTLSKFFNLWLQSRMADADIPFPELLGMHFRKVNVKVVVESYIKARKAGLDVSVQQIEVHNLADGDLKRVTNALIAAKQSGVELTWDAACAMDLSGRDIFDALKEQEQNKTSAQHGDS